MLEGDFHAMGHLIDFKTFRMLQTLNKMYNKVIADETDETTESLWFLGLEKCNVMRHMLRDKKVTTIPTDASVTTPSVPLGRSNSNKAKLETARRSSLAMCNVGEPPLAPTPIVKTEQCSSVSLGGFAANLTAKIFQSERPLLFLGSTNQ